MDHWHRLPENINVVSALSFEDAYPQRPTDWDVMGPEGIEYCSDKWNWEWLQIPEVEAGPPAVGGSELLDVPVRGVTEAVAGTREVLAACIDTNDCVHPQSAAQDGGSAGGNGGEYPRRTCSNALILLPDSLPFPRDRDQLVDYLARGLALTRLFPVTGRNVDRDLVCKGQLELTGDEWTVMEKACNKLQANSTNLRRHIKKDHLNVPGDSLTIKELVASWKIYPDFKAERLDRKLRVSPWDNLTQPFPPSPPRQAREQIATPTPIPIPTSPPSTSPECKARVVTKTKELKIASREGKGSGKRTGRA